MKSVNIAELKNRLSMYLDEVRAGNEILVRDRNTPIARILPFIPDADDDAELQALAAQGRIRLGKGAIEDDFWKLPAPRVPAAALKRAIEAERDGD